MAAIVRARNELVRVAFALDPPQTIGRPRRMSTLETIQLIVYMCRAGCPWSMLPCPHAVSYKTVYHRFNLWSRMRIFERALRRMRRMRLRRRALRLLHSFVHRSSLASRHGSM